MQYKTLLLSFLLVSCFGRSNNAGPETAVPGLTSNAPYVIYQPGQPLVPEVIDNSADTRIQISRHIMDICQDDKGNSWFATFDDGICRYDGTRFVYFGKKEGLSGNTVYSITPGNDGTLWMATSEGLCRYNGYTFTRFSLSDGLPAMDCRNLFTDSRGRTWVHTTAGTCYFDNGKFIPFKLPASATPSLAEESTALVTAMTEDREGRIWFATDGGALYSCNMNNPQEKAQQWTTGNTTVTALLTDKNGIVWAGFRDGGVAKLAGNEFEPVNTPDTGKKAAITALSTDPGGTIYCATLGDGLHLLKAGKWQTIREPFFTKNQIRSVMTDNTGKIWCGFSGGVFWLNGTKLVNLIKMDSAGDGC